jgi:cyclic pyranopterin phosphate synthase
MTELTHLDSAGAARMVDVSAKRDTVRTARASGVISMSAEALAAIRDGASKKGDVIAVARIAGIMAAKKTSEMIPLCHPLALSSVALEFELDELRVIVTATAKTTGPTGVEMEALTAVTVALLTVYDMAKAIDKGMVISGISLLTKTGGKSGDWARAAC